MQHPNPKISGPYENISQGANCVMAIAVIFMAGTTLCLLAGAIAAIVWAFVKTLHFVNFEGEHYIHWPNLVAIVLVFLALRLLVKALSK